TMSLTIELRVAGAGVDRRFMQVEWLARTPTPPPTVSLDPGEVARLFKRGEDLLTNGEIAAARAVVRRLARHGEGRGAPGLAQASEGATLEGLGAWGIAPEVAMAKLWYEKARELGSPEAQRRLDVLASRGR